MIPYSFIRLAEFLIASPSRQCVLRCDVADAISVARFVAVLMDLKTSLTEPLRPFRHCPNPPHSTTRRESPTMPIPGRIPRSILASVAWKARTVDP